MIWLVYISKRKSEWLHLDSGCQLLPAPTAGWARLPEPETAASTWRFHLVLPSGQHPANDSQKKLFNRPPSTSQGPSGSSFHLGRKSKLHCLASLPQSHPQCRSNHVFSFSKCILSSGKEAACYLQKNPILSSLRDLATALIQNDLTLAFCFARFYSLKTQSRTTSPTKPLSDDCSLTACPLSLASHCSRLW